jgi:DNA-3-methyladenine glycosylase II
MTTTDQIIARGPFSLRAAAEFGFGPDEGHPPAFDGAMRLAFPSDAGRGHVGAVLRQAAVDGPVRVDLELRGDVDADAALAQVARTVSLDHDGERFMRLGEGDPVLGALQRAHPGQRPVLFCSPYEAAAWSVLSARRPAQQGARVRAALATELGEMFELAHQSLPAFPIAERLAEIPDGFPGLGATKIERLRAVAAAALAGKLDVTRIQALGPEAAYAEIQRIPGIGPFYAALVVLRASGFADAWLDYGRHRGLDHAARYYGLEGELDAQSAAELAERWRPFRTWALVLMRIAGERGTRIATGR